MKLFAVILAVALFFGYTFIQSGAWDVQVTTVDKEGVDVAKRRHTIYWDRYFAYLKGLPKRWFKSAETAISPEPKKDTSSGATTPTDSKKGKTPESAATPQPKKK